MHLKRTWTQLHHQLREYEHTVTKGTHLKRTSINHTPNSEHEPKQAQTHLKCTSNAPEPTAPPITGIWTYGY